METNNKTSWRDARRVPSMRVPCAKGGTLFDPPLDPTSSWNPWLGRLRPPPTVVVAFVTVDVLLRGTHGRPDFAQLGRDAL